MSCTELHLLTVPEPLHVCRLDQRRSFCLLAGSLQQIAKAARFIRDCGAAGICSLLCFGALYASQPMLLLH